MDGNSPMNPSEAAKRDRLTVLTGPLPTVDLLHVGFESELHTAAQEAPAVLPVETLEQEAQDSEE